MSLVRELMLQYDVLRMKTIIDRIMAQFQVMSVQLSKMLKTPSLH